MMAYRICHRDYRLEDPTGSLRNPGRWHEIGQGVLYFASSLSLAILEMKANGVSFGALRSRYRYGCIELDPKKAHIEAIPNSFFNNDWTLRIEDSRTLGSGWIKKRRSLLLEVKSAVLATEQNYVVNTSHPDFSRIRFTRPKAIPLDPRI